MGVNPVLFICPRRLRAAVGRKTKTRTSLVRLHFLVKSCPCHCFLLRFYPAEPLVTQHPTAHVGSLGPPAALFLLPSESAFRLLQILDVGQFV